MTLQSQGIRQMIGVEADTPTAVLITRIDDIARVFWILIIPA